MTKSFLSYSSKNWLVISAFIFLFVVSMVAGQFRFIARDEGFYLYAARLISEGFLPYRDFFFPQTPFVPFLYAGWFWICGADWISGRALASLLTFVCGILLFIYAQHVYGRRVGIVTIFLFAVSSIVQIWLPTAQTDSASVLLLVAVFVAICAYRSYFWTGLLLGVTVLSRLTFAPAALVILPILLFTKDSVFLSRRIILFALGLTVPTAIALYFWYLDPHNFIAHNLEYHLERTALTPDQLDSHRWKVFVTLLGFRNGVGIGWLQFAVIFYSGILGSIAYFSSKRVLDPLACTGIILFVTHLLPDPTYLQYFVVTAVLLIPLSANYLLSLADRVKFKKVMIVGACTIYAFLGIGDIKRFFVSGDKVIGVGTPNKDSWTLSKIEEVGALIDTFVTPGEKVFASWPGYLVSAKAHAYPGTENHFAYTWAERQNFSDGEQDQKKIIAIPRVVDAFRAGSISLAVLFIGVGRTNNLEHDIIKAGGLKVKALRGINMYKGIHHD